MKLGNSSETTGASMLFVLGAMVVTLFMGALMLGMAHSDRVNNIYYKTSETARSAAKSGIISALHDLSEATLGSEPRIVEILNDWTEAGSASKVPESSRWIAGSARGFSQLSDGIEYRVQMLAFDSSSMNITLKSEGVVQDGSRASLMGVYNLKGLIKPQVIQETKAPIDAVYLGGNSAEIMSPLYVEGSMFAGVSATFQTGSGVSTFTGPFRTGVSSNDNEVLNLKGKMTFHKPAYFGCSMSHYGGDLTFKNGLGSENYIYTTSRINLEKGDVYMNGGIAMAGWGNDPKYITAFSSQSRLYGWWNGDSKQRSSMSIANMLYNSSSKWVGEEQSDSLETIRASLGFPTEEEPYRVDLSDILNHQYPVYMSGVTGAKLNRYYDMFKQSGQLFNGEWLIVYAQGGGNTFVSPSNDEKFRGKVIIMFNALEYGKQNDLYDTEPGSMTFLYHSGSLARTLTLRSGRVFRGFIYSNSDYAGSPYSPTDVAVILNAGGARIDGGIYLRNGRFRIEGSGLVTISRNSDLVNELGSMGLFYQKGDTQEKTKSDGKFTVGDAGVSAQLLSQVM